jgi:hypothetical protein
VLRWNQESNIETGIGQILVVRHFGPFRTGRAPHSAADIEILSPRFSLCFNDSASLYAVISEFQLNLSRPALS